MVGAMVVAAMVIPVSGLWAKTPEPVEPKIHNLALKGVHRSAEAPTPPAGYRVVALTRKESVPDFSLLGVTWQRPSDSDVHVQVRTRADGRWSRWAELEAGDDRPDRKAVADRKEQVRSGTVPYYAGDANGVQVLVAAPRGRKPKDLRLDLVDPGDSGYDERIDAEPTAAAHALADRPRIVTRLEWGADESLMTWEPEYSPTLQAGFVHHTDTGNSYTRDEVPGIVRGIYAYHAVNRGWGDIGYNFLVDRFGRAIEGRAGGPNRPVVGGHVYGFNQRTFGVAALGNFTVTAPPAETLTAISDLIAWKLDPYDRDPHGATVLNDQTLDVIAGHRDARATDCPGAELYNRLATVRDRVATLVSTDEQVFVGDWDGDGIETAGKFDDGNWVLRNDDADPESAVTFGFGKAGDSAVVGDWNGDGKTDVGVFRAGEWRLKMGTPGGRSYVKFRFGRSTDIPVVGDWDGDGRTEPGLFRDGEWHLKDAIGEGGTADRMVTFGQAGDRPLFGDWDGDGTDTPAVRRGSTWILRHDLEVPALDTSFSYGQPGDRPVAGNWDGDTSDEIGVVRGMTWLLRNSASAGPTDRTFRM